MIQPRYSNVAIDQHMRGQAWHVESFGNERNEFDPTRHHMTTAWTVFIDRDRDHTYEVAQWSGGAVYKIHTVQIRRGGALSCTCPLGNDGFARSKRGYCNHINRLMVHALQRLPTLPAPAGSLAHLASAGRAVPQGSAMSSSLAGAAARIQSPPTVTPFRPRTLADRAAAVTGMPC